MKGSRRVIVWFRQDLRLHDNEALHEAMKKGDEIVPIYVFDERQFFGKTKFGFQKTGKFRTKFILESIADLRQSFKDKGIDLIIKVGKPEEIVPKLAEDIGAAWVFCNKERTHDEIIVQDEVEKRLWTIGRELYYYRGKMLYYTQDLPFPVAHTPDVFTNFRKEVEKFVQIRDLIPTPKSFKYWTFDYDKGELPTLEDLGHDDFKVDNRSVLNFKGGETAALERLKNYLWDTDLVQRYKETRNGLIGGEYSSKFSPWLAQGCLSPKMIYHEMKRYESERKKNKSTYWMVFEILWRDFFRLMAKKYGNKIFQEGGTKQATRFDWNENKSTFDLWANGKTGIPFIDANMKELNSTGFMSNRGRQNVASFLVKDLEINWQMGAEYFESLLIDYDPASNYGNWNYIAGVGSDPREDRYFNILSQAQRYDPLGEYVKLWLPELERISSDKIHSPNTLSFEEQAIVKVTIGENYPQAMVNL
ncbi:MAG: deoxyribodipyrimidine photo-lyase [Cognaticolwellia sp.]|jgi:deoxyribodipyrimidine photo-lyase